MLWSDVVRFTSIKLAKSVSYTAKQRYFVSKKNVGKKFVGVTNFFQQISLPLNTSEISLMCNVCREISRANGKLSENCDKSAICIPYLQDIILKKVHKCRVEKD